jgi:hypothetical protein
VEGSIRAHGQEPPNSSQRPLEWVAPISKPEKTGSLGVQPREQCVNLSGSKCLHAIVAQVSMSVVVSPSLRQESNAPARAKGT